MASAQDIYQTKIKKVRPESQLRRHPEIYASFGTTLEAQAQSIAETILPGNINKHNREQRREIFEYIILFLHHSTFSAPLNTYVGKGYNLAKRPYLAPTGFRTTNKKGEELPDFFYFAEQYRWDTFFHNQLLSLLGLHELAIGQLLNFVDVFAQYNRIPNALTTDFLSHPQPPTEALSTELVLAAGAEKGEWYHQIMQTVEADLTVEWWDYKSGRVYPRQTQKFVENFGPYMSRYVSIHMHPLLVGCQDGKDHNWINAYYGENYVPVQLNSILYANVCALEKYYTDDVPDQEKANSFANIREKMYETFQKLFWVDSGRWRGFRNYSMGTNDIPEGPILYGDLAAEIFPLYVGLATKEQAKITLENLKNHYEGDIGLAATSPSLREGGSISHAPEGFEFQWEFNAWPPLMMMATDALEKYSENPQDEFASYARKLKQNWIRWIEEEFTNSKANQAHHGKPAMHEKAPYSSTMPVKEGFYGNLRGFGWTIASYLKYLHELNQDGLVE